MSTDLPPDPRVFLAIERTFLAWTRTALALMGFGFVVARLGLLFREFATPPSAAPAGASDSVGSIVLGAALVLVGVAIQSIALIEHVRRVRTFHEGVPIAPMRARLGVVVAGVVIAMGLALTAYLVLKGA